MKKKILSLVSILFTISIATAQSDNPDYLTKPGDQTVYIKKNNIKISLTSLVFNNFQLQYERSLTKRIGVVIGYSFIPKGDVPFKSQINDLTSNDENNQGIFENAVLGYRAFTPEFRFYLGKGYGKGFYIAPFYRNLRYDISKVNFEFSSDLIAQKENLEMGGELTANTFGLQFGAQFNLGKHIILDWWIIGPHYGTAKGDFIGITDRTLTPFEQNQLQNELDNLELPLGDIEARANQNGATINISGPWGGIRSGISLGYRF